MKQIAILHFTAPPEIGSIENSLYHHARLLNRAGHLVNVIAGNGDEAYFETSFHHQIEFHRIPLLHPLHPDVQPISEALLAGRIPPEFDTLRDELTLEIQDLLKEIDLCLIHDVLTSPKHLPFTAALRSLAHGSKQRWIAWCHSFPTPQESALPDGYPWDLFRRPWPGVQYVTISRRDRERLAVSFDLPVDRIQVIPPGIDEAAFLKLDTTTSRLFNKLDLFAADPLLLLPGRILPQRNIEFALHLTAALTRHKPRPTLLIPGVPNPGSSDSTAYLDSLRVLRQETSMEKHMLFLSDLVEEEEDLYITEAILSDLYRLADVLLLPSFEEGFGIPVLGAGLSRLPVFAAEIPALRESTSNQGHFFNPHGDPQTTADALFAFLESDPGYRLRRHILRQYTWEAVAEHSLNSLIDPDLSSPA